MVSIDDDEAPADIPLPQQTEGAGAAPELLAPVAVATAPTAPAAVKQESAPAPVRAHPAQPHDAVPVDPAAASLPTETSDVQDAHEPSASEDETVPVAPDDSQPPVQPTAPVMASPVPIAPLVVAQSEIAPAQATHATAAGPSPVSRSTAAPTPMPRPVPGASVDSPSLAATEATKSPTPVTSTPPAVASNDAAPLPIEAAPLSSVAPKPEAIAASPLLTQAAIDPTDRLVEQTAIGKSAATPAPRPASQPAPATPIQNASPPPAAEPAPQATPASPITAPLAETVATTPVAMPVPAEPLETADQPIDIAQASPPAAPAKPRAEAVSLLELVRDHMGLRVPRRIETAVPGQDVATDAAPAILTMATNDSISSLAPLVQPTVQPLAATAPSIPTVDLSARLGAQVVDMGVSGQWIDGLARDIAGLSANGAQGRFQINADQLGPIQVDIRQGEDGATISLTVATEAAEQALRQEGDRLKLDAGLSAMRISEMKIERAPHVAETARADSSGNQTMSQQQSGGQNQNQGQNGHQAMGQGTGQGMGQSSAQSHMQGRGQQRENIALGHKAGSDAAVLNHTDVGENAGGAVRARYA
ncbi:flagellar hook-length control protein FliK [Sphingobium sp. AR-3-1]|uniref:Flagellar hook-length control protein FliK n=2 Tax=Sphingobium psychrophilum TaxID=2728834 RepID=A0A7X9ZS36_9SPHN|nr:flagellar hook-length control protein FliK [Sphingobium psychrophilum]